jgi:hypothetical protein
LLVLRQTGGEFCLQTCIDRASYIVLRLVDDVADDPQHPIGACNCSRL